MQLQRSLETDRLIATALIEQYATFNHFGGATSIFEAVLNDKKDAVSIRSVFRTMVNNGEHEKALTLYLQHLQCPHNASFGALDPSVFTEIVRGFLVLETPENVESLCHRILNVDQRAVNNRNVIICHGTRFTFCKLIENVT